MELLPELVDLRLKCYDHYWVESIDFGLHLVHGVLQHFHVNLCLDIHLHLALI